MNFERDVRACVLWMCPLASCVLRSVFLKCLAHHVIHKYILVFVNETSFQYYASLHSHISLPLVVHLYKIQIKLQ